MSTYRNGQSLFDADAPDAQALLATMYKAKARPLCECITAGIAMYIAKIGSGYIVKRMPNTGMLHAPECAHYEPPAELSGLGDVMGSAIQENADDGVTTLKFDFSLTKRPGRAPPATDASAGDSVKTDGKRLTMRGTLHYLWDEAGFNRWTPAMEGRRSWNVIHKYLMQAVSGKEAKSTPLGDSLFIPETFFLEQKDQINARRTAKLGKLAVPGQKNVRRLMLLIAEVKEIAPARYGHKIVVKHLPDYHFMLAEDVHKRLFKRFANELALWDAVDGTHLIIAGSFGVGPTGFASLEEIALMTVTDQWVPFETVYDKMVLDALQRDRRSYVKGLRYNLPANRPLATAVVADTRPEPVAMYVIPAEAKADYEVTLKELTSASRLRAWYWQPAADNMPAVPPIEDYHAMAMPAFEAEEAAEI